MVRTSSKKSETMQLGEAARRRPDFSPGEVVVLGDGKQWSLPLIKGELVSSVDSAGDIRDIVWRIGSPSDLECEEQFAESLAYIKALTADDRAKFSIAIAIRIGVVLLLRNYRLSEKEAEYLLFQGFLDRLLTDSNALKEAGTLYGAVHRIALDRPQEAIKKLLKAMPKAVVSKSNI